DFYYSSPLHYLPNLEEGAQLAELRERFILLATGEGRWEHPGESWGMAHVLGTRDIPNRVDLWGDHYDHDWPTWREMLPKYLDEMA
ncbi:MAG: esterase family protein, partial [Planctomycetota bacterium]